MFTSKHVIIFYLQVAYTFDAGPNACLYLLEKDVDRVTSLVCHFFQPEYRVDPFVTGISTETVEIEQVVL